MNSAAGQERASACAGHRSGCCCYWLLSDPGLEVLWPVGGCHRYDAVLSGRVEEESDVGAVVANLEEAICRFDVSMNWGRRGRLVHLPYCPFPDWDDQEQGDWQERALLPNLRWYQQSVMSGLEGVGVAERSRVRREPDEREGDRAL